MKKKNIFDNLENAEDELMDDFTDMSPGISDDQLEKLLAVSERNYRMKKKEIERTRKDNDTEGEYTVSGVDRIKRPVWLTPLITAASVVLIAGAVIGSVSLMKNNRNVIIGDDTHISAEQSGQSGTESTSVSGFGSATDTVVTVTALGTDNKTTKTTETDTSDTTARLRPHQFRQLTKNTQQGRLSRRRLRISSSTTSCPAMYMICSQRAATFILI